VWPNDVYRDRPLLLDLFCGAGGAAMGYQHFLDDVSRDDEGGWWSACTCGNAEGPFIDRESAIDAHAYHRADALDA
jgi:hypothetical protein